MTKIQVKTSLERQIPEFIREDYQLFVTFVKAYYEFLEQTQSRNLEDIRSISKTLDEFVEKFKKELSVLLPTSNMQNERVFLERIREFYNIRGSKESYKLLFRLLFNKDVDVFYPSTQILRVSDGKWIQDKSVFVKLESGNLFDLKGQIINIHTDKKVLNVYCPNVIYYRDDIYEIFIDKAYHQDIAINDHVEYNGASGYILPCPAKYKISTPGAGFEIGALYNLPTATGKGSTIKITGVGSNGEIRRIQIITFGLDYETNFYAKLSNKTRQALPFYHPVVLYPNSGVLDPNDLVSDTPYEDAMSDYINFGYFINQDYLYYDTNYIPVNYDPEAIDIHTDVVQSEWYVDTTYVGDIIATFYTNEGGVVIDEDVAEIAIELGPVAIYPGYYSTNDGFVSDESFIQDGEYYQLFSYVLKVEEQIDTYKNVVKSLLHPSGLKMFGQYNISNEYQVDASPLLAFIRLQFIEYIDTFFDSEPEKEIHKPFDDILQYYTEYLEKIVTKPIDSDILTSDSVKKFVDKVIDGDPSDDIAIDFDPAIDVVKHTSKPSISSILNSYIEALFKDIDRDIASTVEVSGPNGKYLDIWSDEGGTFYQTVSIDTENYEISFGKNVDSAAVLETGTFERVVDYSRTFQSTQYVSDQINKLFTFDEFSDSLSTADAYVVYRQYFRDIEDSITTSVLSFLNTLTKGISDNVTTGEYVSKDISKTISASTATISELHFSFGKSYTFEDSINNQVESGTLYFNIYNVSEYDGTANYFSEEYATVTTTSIIQ